MDQFRPTYHRNGAVSIWSVYEQRWRYCLTIEDVGDREFAAMGARERERVMGHLTTDTDCQSREVRS
jgi:hypothetical protein